MKDDFDKFSEDLLDLAGEFKGGREAKKYVRRQANKLKTKTKKVYKSMGIGEGETSKEVIKSFKASKGWINKRGEVASKVYNKYYIALWLNNGFIHQPDGKYVPGYRFMEKAKDDFEEEFYKNTEEWLDDLIYKKGLH